MLRENCLGKRVLSRFDKSGQLVSGPAKEVDGDALELRLVTLRRSMWSGAFFRREKTLRNLLLRVDNSSRVDLQVGKGAVRGR